MKSPYDVTYRGIKLDPYRIFDLYGITHPCQQHSLKKILRAGKSHKSLKQDIQESIDTLERWKQMISEDEENNINERNNKCSACGKWYGYCDCDSEAIHGKQSCPFCGYDSPRHSMNCQVGQG